MRRKLVAAAQDDDDEDGTGGDPPSPITLIPVRKQSHLPSISEIHHLRLNLNAQLMHANGHSSGGQFMAKRTKSTYVTAPSSPAMAARKSTVATDDSTPHAPPPPPSLQMGAHSADDDEDMNSRRHRTDDEEYNDLHLYLIREHYKCQKSFVHSSRENEMKRLEELREVKRHILRRSNSGEQEVTRRRKGFEANALIENVTGNVLFKRNSFLRNSWNVIMRHSFRLSGHQSHSARSSWESNGSAAENAPKNVEKRQTGSDNEKKSKKSEKSVKVPRTPTNSKCSSDSEFFGNRFSFQSLRRKAVAATGGHKRNSSSSSFFSNR